MTCPITHVARIAAQEFPRPGSGLEVQHVYIRSRAGPRSVHGGGQRSRCFQPSGSAVSRDVFCSAVCEKREDAVSLKFGRKLDIWFSSAAEFHTTLHFRPKTTDMRVALCPPMRYCSRTRASDAELYVDVVLLTDVFNGRGNMLALAQTGNSHANPRPTRPLELRLYRYFVILAEELHFARAAERLCVGQSNLSREIRSLEHLIGFKLFYRTSRRTELTAAGERLLESARRVLAAEEHARLAIGELKRSAKERLRMCPSGKDA